MKTKTIAAMFLAAATLPIGGYAVHAQAQTSQASDPEFMAKLRAALNENPEIVLEAAQAAQERMQVRQRAEQEAAIGPVRTELSAQDTVGVVIGNPNGTENIIEFLDYNCGFCKRSHPEVIAKINEDPNARVILMMRPILGPSSTTLAKYALAADMQGKFMAADEALMTERNDGSDAQLAALSAKIGVDWTKARTDMNGEAVATRLAKHEEYAERISVRGTPFFITETKIIPGAVTKDQLN